MLAAVAIALTLSVPVARTDGVGPRVEDLRVLGGPDGAPDAIAVRGAVKVEVISGIPGVTVSVEAEQNLQAMVRTVVERGVLRIETVGDPISVKGITARVTVPKLSRLSATGAAQVTAPLRGACTIEVSGAAQMRLSGAPEAVTIVARGAASLDARQLSAERITVALDGAAEVDLGPSDALLVTGRGVGRVRYRGTPTVSTDVGPSVKVTRLRT